MSFSILLYFLELMNDLGSVFKPFTTFLGVVKDRDNPYLFDLSSDSILTTTTTPQFVTDYLKKCQMYLNTANTVFEDISLSLHTSAGPLIKKTIR